jgi:cytochrome c oxidase assembly protein subunit 11
MKATTMSGVARNRMLLAKLSLATLAMFGFGYLLAPLYDRLCGAERPTQTAAKDAARPVTRVDLARTIAVQYDANVHGSLHWSFRPLQKSSQVHPGELVHIRYEMTNESDQPVIAQAVPSYAPPAAAAYFHKIECFCFKRQALRPHETKSMPVVFLIDPAIPGDLPTITLSYTFFEVRPRKSA